MHVSRWEGMSVGICLHAFYEEVIALLRVKPEILQKISKTPRSNFPKITNTDLSPVIIMTKIVALSDENTDLVLTHLRKNDLVFVKPCFIVIKQYINTF